MDEYRRRPSAHTRYLTQRVPYQAEVLALVLEVLSLLALRALRALPPLLVQQSALERSLLTVA